MNTLEKAIKEDKYIPFTFWKNAPTLDILNVVKETEKAVCVKHEEVGKEVWLPKASFEAFDIGGVPYFTLKKWIKPRLSKYQQRALFVLV